MGAIYCGWGPEAAARNPGDLLCLRGAQKLLAECGSYGWTDARSTYEPVHEPEFGDVVIGGGTVLPTVFDPRHAPGLAHADRLYIFGSGFLHPDEWKNTIVGPLDPRPYLRARVIGVRGPVSVNNYKKCFGVSVPYVGDLAFAYAEKQTSPRNFRSRRTERCRASFFLIENDRGAARMRRSLQEIINLFVELQISLDMECVLMTTDDPVWSHETARHLTGNFHNRVSIKNVDQYIERIKNSDFIITERLHPAVLASCFGIPFLYMQTTSKSRDLAALLTTEGVPRECFLDMAMKPEDNPARHACKLASRTELPEILLTAACQIRRRLENGAFQIAHESAL